MKTEINGISYTIEESFNDILLITKGGQDLIIENGYSDIKSEAIAECSYPAKQYFDEGDSSFDDDEVKDWILQYLPDFVSENFENAKPLTTI